MSPWPSAALARCCAGSGSGACRCGPAIRSRILRRRRHTKKLRRSGQSRHSRACARKTDRTLVAGRSPGWSAGHIDPRLGRARQPAAPPRDQRHEWAYIFGAVCPRRDIGAALVLPYANAQAMNLHLEEISCQVTQDSHAVLLLDGAGWHQTGEKLRVPGNISLLQLPSYSPELNPVENIWQFLRQNHLG